MKLFSAAAVFAVLIAAIAPSVSADSTPQFSTYADFQNANNYTIFNAILRTTGLLDKLQNSAYNMTIFAPTDAAFQQLATSQNTDLIPLLAGSDIKSLLQYHFVNTTTPISAVNLYNGEQLPTWLVQNGQVQNLSIQGSGATMTLAVVGGNPSNVVGFQNYNIGAGTGFIQGINGVLIPATSSSTSDSSTA